MIENIKDAKEQLLEYIDKDELEDMIETDEPHDIISELADSNVDVYTKNLIEWFSDGENYGNIEDAIEEFGFPKSDGKPDIVKAIMQGQYHANEQLLWEAWKEIKEEHKKE